MFFFVIPRGGLASVVFAMFLVPMMVVGGLAGPAFVGYMVYTGLTTEWDYHARYGETWKEHFREEQRISVEETNQRMMVGSGALIVIGGLCYLIYRQIVPNRIGHSRSRRRRRRSSSSA